MYKQILIYISTITVIAVVFQNCDNGLFLQDGGLGALESSSSGSLGFSSSRSQTGSSFFDGSFNANNGQAFDSGRVNLKGLNWVIEWSDEFHGPAGAKVQKPWHYAMRPLDGNRHRHGILSEQDAFLDGQSHLKMRTVMRNGKPTHSFLRSSDFDGGNMNVGLPNNYLLDPRPGPLYIETSVRLDRAYQSEDAWWAFWLFSPNTWDKNNNRLWSPFSADSPRLDPYDNNPQTGMEVDIFEYVPYLGSSPYESRNGFNMAVFTNHDPVRALHMTSSLAEGFVPDINNFLSRFKGISNSGIQLTDGNYHRIGMYWDMNRYEFYIDGYLIWQVTNPSFITRTRANAIILSWEVQNDLWGDQASKTFQTNNREVFVLIDYVRVYRAR